MMNKSQYCNLEDYFPSTHYYRDHQLTPLHQTIIMLFQKQNKIIGSTRLQKLLFLFDKELSLNDDIGYRGYKFGPYSQQVTLTMDELIELDLIKKEVSNENPTYDINQYVPAVYNITDEGQEVSQIIQNDLSSLEAHKLEHLVDKYGFMEMNQLLQYVYDEYPEFTEESIIRDQVLAGKTVAS